MIYQFAFDPVSIFGSLSASVIRIALALMTLLVGFILGKVVEKFVLRVLKEIEINKLIHDTFRFKINADQIISNMLLIVIYFISIVAALEQIGLANRILYVLSLAVIAVIIISFFLAVRDLIPNVISGIYIYTRERMKEGIQIEIDDIKGELLHIELLHTKIKAKNGDIFLIPNSTVAKSKIRIITRN